AGASRQPAALTIAGELFGDDLQDRADDLHALLEAPEVRVFPRHDSERHWLAVPVRVSTTPLVTGELELTVELQAPDSAQHGALVTVNAETPSGLSLDVPLTVAGRAPAYPELTITCRAGASFSDLLIATDDGAYVELSGSFTAGDVIAYDAARYHLTVNGASAAHRITDEAALAELFLTPGARTLSFMAGGSVLDVAVSVSWRPRWPR
ncbi:MAG TPA: hypothetical protein VF158_09070, partial [Longimicrobiales bacterium]